MSNLREDCRRIADGLEPGDTHRSHLIACCEQSTREPKQYEMMHFDFRPPWLDAPCLVLLWRRSCPSEGRVGRFDWTCTYRLMMPISEFDIRGKLLHIPMGATRVGAGKPDWTPIWPGEGIDTPFRDGTHIRRDMHRLNLRGFVVARKMIQELEPLE